MIGTAALCAYRTDKPFHEWDFLLALFAKVLFHFTDSFVLFADRLRDPHRNGVPGIDLHPKYGY